MLTGAAPISQGVFEATGHGTHNDIRYTSRGLNACPGTPYPFSRMTIKEHLQRELGRDLRAAMADVCGYSVLSPDQERLVEVVQTRPRVAACGGTGTGKSFVYGTAAALVIATGPTKALFGGPKQEQAARLSWLELQRALRAAHGCGFNIEGAGCGSLDWYPQGKAWPDWYGTCMALSDRNNAASVKGMLHAPRVLVVLDELEGVAAEVRDALDAGTGQEQSHFLVAFNPVNEQDAAGQFWTATPPEARVQLSSLACAEWQERTGHRIPGMPTLAALEAKWHGRENDPLYYTNVLGQFPPQSAQWVIVPGDWYDACVKATPTNDKLLGIGVDTAGGRSENVIATVQGRTAAVAWASRELHQTPRLVLEVERIADGMGGQRVPIAVDVIGQGGKGVADQLRADGYTALDFVGGGREFNGQRDPADLTADVATWAWFSVRDAARATVEGRPSLRLPDDPVLRAQFARRYDVTGERRYKLESKDGSNSPDRADAVAMAWLAANLGQPVSRVVMLPEYSAAPEPMDLAEARW